MFYSNLSIFTFIYLSIFLVNFVFVISVSSETFYEFNYSVFDFIYKSLYLIVPPVLLSFWKYFRIGKFTIDHFNNLLFCCALVALHNYLCVSLVFLPIHIVLFTFYPSYFAWFHYHTIHSMDLYSIVFLVCNQLQYRLHIIPYTYTNVHTQSLRIPHFSFRNFLFGIFIRLPLFILFIICLFATYIFVMYTISFFVLILPLIIYFIMWYFCFQLHKLDAATLVAESERYFASLIATKSRPKVSLPRKLAKQINFHAQSMKSNIGSTAILLGVDETLFRQMISIIESVFLLSLQLNDASSKKMQAIAVAAFVKGLNGGESLSLDIMERVDEAFSTHIEPQSFLDFVNSGKEAHRSAHNIADSPGIQKVYKFMMYVLSLGLFSRVGITLSKAGYSRIEEASIKRKHTSKLGLLDSLLDMSLFICTAGYQAYQGMSIEHIVHSPNSYGDFYDTVEVFMQDYDRYKATNVGSGVQHSQLLVRLSDLLQKYHAIEAILPQLSSIDKKVILGVRGKLLSCEAEMKSENICQSTRDAPFSILLYGDTGVGKSLLTEILFSQFGKIRDLPVEPQMKYTRSPVAQFWDGFDPKMWCLALDDIAWQHPKVGVIDVSVSELLHLINNVPYVTNQASLDKKGTAPFLGHFVIGSTNTRHLNAANYFSYPAAARRRFPFIVDVTVKPEFADKKGKLKGEAKKSANTGFANFWNFQVNEVSAFDRNVIERVILDTDSMGEFLAWFNTKVDDFYSVQQMANDSIQVVHKAKLCDGCRLPDTFCSCFTGIDFEAQSLVVLWSLSMLSVGACIGITLQAYICMYMPSIVTKIFCTLILNRAQGVTGAIKTVFYDWTGQQRRAFECVGARVQERVVKIPRIFLVFAGLITAGVAMRYFTSSTDAQGDVNPLTKEREDYFYSDTIETTKFEATDIARCMDFDSMRNRVSQNVAYASINDATETSICRLLGLGGNLFLTNNHCVPLNPTALELKLGPDRNGICQVFATKITEKDVMRNPSKDIAIIRLMSAPPRRDIRNLFLNVLPTGISEGEYVDRSKQGVIDTIKMPRITYSKQKLPELNLELLCGVSDVSGTQRGQCGMPLLATSGQGKAILGIHSMGGRYGFRTIAGATLITQQDIDDLCTPFEDQCLDWESPCLSSQNLTRVLGPLNANSVTRFVEDGVATIHGSFKGFRPTPKSNVGDTILRPHLLKYGISTTVTKPVMSGWRPWRVGILAMSQPVNKLDCATIRRCGDAYLQHVTDRLPAGAIKKILEPYDEFTAVNGVAGVAFLDPVKKGTSAGAPFNQSKKHHLEKEIPQRGLIDPVKLAPEMSARVRNVRDTYAQGKAYRPVFTAHLKDEAVSAKKAAIGKTRIFCGAPFDWSVVVRELFLSHVRLIQNFKFEFECAVGTVAPSEEWTELYELLTKFGVDRIVAGDYKDYDKRMPPVLVKEAFRILIVLAEKSGNFSPEQIRAMWCVCNDTAYPLIDFNGDLITFWGSNPSGHPLTVIINSIANSLYMRYAFEANGYDLSIFSDNVALVTYGDDNAMSVSKRCDNFNHTTIQKALADVGVVYTMADKESASVPYVNIADITFLKRGWRWDEENRVYLAPLEEASIVKSLCVMVKSKSITPSEQISEIIRSAQMEWWHYGEDVFKSRTKMLNELIITAKLEDYFREVPLRTFGALWKQFYECSAKTKRIL